MTYTNNRGKEIPHHQIDAMLKNIDKTEKEIIHFLGPRINIPGYFLYFIQHIQTMDDYYDIKSKSHSPVPPSDNG